MCFLIFSLVHSGLIESKEKREHDNQIIKTIPPIPEAGLLALNVILNNNNTANKNSESNRIINESHTKNDETNNNNNNNNTKKINTKK